MWLIYLDVLGSVFERHSANSVPFGVHLWGFVSWVHAVEVEVLLIVVGRAEVFST